MSNNNENQANLLEELKERIENLEAWRVDGADPTLHLFRRRIKAIEDYINLQGNGDVTVVPPRSSGGRRKKRRRRTRKKRRTRR